jgi:amino acid adenylation domain-containing protein
MTQKSALDEWLSRKKKTSISKTIPCKPDDKPALLSYGQERLWLLDQLYPNQAFYNYAQRYRIVGEVDIDRLITSFEKLSERHEVILANYQVQGENGVEQIKGSHFSIENIDLSLFSDGHLEQELLEQRKRCVAQPFNLAEEPLLRLFIFKINETSFELLLVMHHILGDAWSLGIINNEISEIYKALSDQREISLEKLEIQYKDFAYWQRQQEIKPVDLDYWKGQLSGELAILDLPIDRSRQVNDFSGGTLKKSLSGNLKEKLQALATNQSTTMYVLLLTAFKLFLNKYCRQTDVLVGSPFSNRDMPVLEKLIGFFNETLVLRTNFEGNPTFPELLEQVKQNTLAALTHKNVPFNTIVNELRPDRQAGENPLFQTMFLYNIEGNKLNLGKDIMLEEEMLDLGISKFDLTLFVNDGESGLEIVFEHTTRLPDPIVADMATLFETLLEKIVENSENVISEISMFSDNMLRDLSVHWHGKKEALPDYQSVHQLISHWVEQRPAHKAVTFGDTSLNYQELDLWAQELEEKLRAKGVGIGSIVGLYTHRSLEMVAGILGILKSGAAYLPLDPDYPDERINFMLNDAGVNCLLCAPDVLNKLSFEQGDIITIERDAGFVPNSNAAIENLLDETAYIIYTSGSTGKPKGVLVTHQNLIHSTSARTSFFEDDMHSFLLLSSFSFDSSVVGIFWSLCSGGTLVLPPKRIEQDIELLASIIRQNSVSHTLLLPSLYQVLLNNIKAIDLSSLKAVIVAGEACSLTLSKSHFKKLPWARLYNEYGPTEASVWCIAHEITSSDRTIPIGKPISNTSTYVLDDQLNPIPLGVSGELYIGGMGITKGYLNRPELTQERFVENPFEKGSFIYKTGDLAKFRTDGVLEFLGRADEQIKIRGFRVELEEITSHILLEPGVSDAIVEVKEDANSNKKLVAWIQSEDSNAGKTMLLRLKRSLPNYMIPASVNVLAAFPKLPNGKVDRKKLQESEIEKQGLLDIVPPSNEKQKLLVAIWQEVLKIENVGIEDNFFDIGGDSILSIQIIASARRLGLKIGPTQLFEYQNIQALSEHILNENDVEHIEEEEIVYPLTIPLSYQQQAFLFHSLQSKEDQGLLQLEFRLEGPIDSQHMQTAWAAIIDQHPVMRTSFEWNDLESASQVVHASSSIPWTILDISERSEDEQNEALMKFKAADLAKGLNLKEPGCSRISLIKYSHSEHVLCWTCHHILIDGWSGGIILKDALEAYENLVILEPIKLSPVSHFGKFLDWKSQQDLSTSSNFWKTMLEGAKSPLFGNYALLGAKSKYQDLTIYPDKTTIDKLNALAQEQRLTLNTMMQGLWMLTLRQFFNQKDITLGMTVSGRSADFEGIDRITGLFMNVLPVRKVFGEGSVVEYFQELQELLNKLRSFEHTDVDQIQDWAGASKSRALFDSLFVFGNFLKDGLKVGNLAVKNFNGGFSSTFPLTLRVNPTTKFEINCRYDQGIVTDEAARWLMDAYMHFVTIVSQSPIVTLSLSELTLDAPTFLSLKSEQKHEPRSETKGFIGAQNRVQLDLLKFWEESLATSLIGIYDNFFELGGTSLGAIQLFSRLENHFGKKLSPTALITYPTIAQLSEFITKDTDEEALSSIIPMKTSGTSLPLFCLHSGGAHVLFYQGLAKYISADRPVYAIQPSGIDGEEDYHENIPEMAAHYIEEMRKIQMNGPYHLIGTCFGNAVGVEMIHQLNAIGEKVAVFYVVDSAPAYLEPPSPNGERKPVRRMITMIKSGNWRGIIKKFRNRYIRLDKKLKANQRDEQEVELDEMIDSLNNLYVKYVWRPIQEEVVLIRSREFSERKDKIFHLQRWKALAQGGLEIHEIEGHHLTLFDEPEVQGLTSVLSKHLSGLETS